MLKVLALMLEEKSHVDIYVDAVSFVSISTQCLHVSGGALYTHMWFRLQLTRERGK